MMSPPSRPTTTPATPTTATTTTTAATPTTPPGARSSRQLLLLLTALLMLSTLPTPASSVSFMDTFKSSLQGAPPSDCQVHREVSLLCFQCASFDPSRFHAIHNACCLSDGRVRAICEDWYTEEPKRGRRDVWYY